MKKKGLISILTQSRPGNTPIGALLLLTTLVLLPLSLVAAPSDAAVLASETVTIESRSEITGNILSSYLEMRPDSTIYSNIDLAGNAELRDRAKVFGTLSTEGSLFPGNNTYIQQVLYIDEPGKFPKIPVQSFPVGGGTFEIPNDSTISLAPGVFGDTIFRARSTVNLQTGSYSFKSLNIEPDTIVNFNTEAGPIRLNVAGFATLGSRANYNKTGAGNILLYGLENIFLQPDLKWPGSIAAPLGKLSIESRINLSGAIGAREIFISPDSHINANGSTILTEIRNIPTSYERFETYVVAEDIAPFGSVVNLADGTIFYDQDNWINAGEGDETIYAGPGDDVIRGGMGDDILYGETGNDTIAGGNGNDFIDGFDGNNELSGGPGHDHIVAASGSNIINGGSGNDLIQGGIDNDWILGGTGSDTVYALAGDDIFVYEPGHGTDYFSGGAGHDTLGLDKVISLENWSITVNGLTQDLSQFLYTQAATSSFSGTIHTPDGQNISFDEVEEIKVNYPLYQSGQSIPLALPEINLPVDTLTAMITGLPKSVIIKEAGVPMLNQDGKYFQQIDLATIGSGRITLDVQPGFFGELNLSYTIFSGNPDAPQTQSTAIDLYIAPSEDAALFAQLGDYNVDIVNGLPVQSRVPLDIIVNPLIEDDFTVTLSGIPAAVSLYRPDGSQIPVTAGQAVLSRYDLTALSMALNGYTQAFNIQVLLQGQSELYVVESSASIAVPAAQNIYLGDNGDTIVQFMGPRSNYVVNRVGNALEIAPVISPESVTRVSMATVDHLRFNDSFVSSRDYSTVVNIFSDPQYADLANFLQTPDGMDPSTILLVRYLPDGAVLNNAIPLDKGVFALPVKDILGGVLNIDHYDTNFTVLGGMKVEAFTATEAEMEILNGAARVNGYANAKLFAEAGYNANLSVGPDGVRMGARAYVEASFVANAGGSINVDGVGSASVMVNAEVHLSAEISAHFQATNDEIRIQAYAGAEATASLSADGEVELAAIPGTSAKINGALGASSYAYASGDGGIHYGEGDYGLDGNVDLGAGVSATAAYYTQGQVAGIGANGGAGVRAGVAVDFGVGGEFGYQHGNFRIGFEGEIQLLIGIEFDLGVNLNFNEVADTAVLIYDGVVDVVTAFGEGLIDGVTLVARGLVSLGDAVLAGFLSAEDAVVNFLGNSWDLLDDYVALAWNQGSEFLQSLSGYGIDALSTAKDILGDGIETIGDIGSWIGDQGEEVVDWFSDRGQDIEDTWNSFKKDPVGSFIDVIKFW